MKNTMTGNRVLLKIKGQKVGFGTVQDASFSDDFGLQDVDGIGTPEAQELVTGKVSHTISLSKYFIAGKTLQKLGFVPTSDDYLTSGELEIEVSDKVSGVPLELYTGCKAATHARQYNKHVISSENVTFRALHKEPL